MSVRKPIAAGNWKMNGLQVAAEEISKLDGLIAEGADARCEVLICPPFTLLHECGHRMMDTKIKLGAQDCHIRASGAHTGDISAEMLKDAGCDYVIVGHSERRADHGETNEVVRLKAEAAYRAGLIAIICIGETALERESGATLRIIENQLKNSLPKAATPDNTVIAYEPVWAIGTGKVPSAADVEEVHTFIRKLLTERFKDAGAGFRVLYGGSVKASNAGELMSVPNVDGALVGGASLKAADFNGIIDAYRL